MVPSCSPASAQDGIICICTIQDAQLKHAVTSGEWEARKVHYVDEKNGWVYFTGTRDSHIAENLYRVKLDGAIERLTRSTGQHEVSMSPTGKYYIDRWSNASTPTQVALYASDGTKLRMLDTNPVYEREQYRFGEYEQFQIKTADGFLLEASLLKPPDFDSGKKYPVWFMTYAGPHMPTISDSWQNGRAHDQMLAQMGMLVFRCDPRTASGKGACSAWPAYRQLGVQELKDIEEAIRWLKQQPYVDGDRIGMSGHSYGGFMTAYALTHSKLFAGGIAGAPPTDWHLYDTIYTERYMDTPQNNPEGYERTSVVKAAKDLHGQLLLLHGEIDDNVHVENTFKLVNALQEADKPFQLMIYPKSRHGISGTHYQRLMVDFIRSVLRLPVPTDSRGSYRQRPGGMRTALRRHGVSLASGMSPTRIRWQPLAPCSLPIVARAKRPVRKARGLGEPPDPFGIASGHRHLRAWRWRIFRAQDHPQGLTALRLPPGIPILTSVSCTS